MSLGCLTGKINLQVRADGVQCSDGINTIIYWLLTFHNMSLKKVGFTESPDFCHRFLSPIESSQTNQPTDTQVSKAKFQLRFFFLCKELSFLSFQYYKMSLSMFYQPKAVYKK